MRNDVVLGYRSWRINPWCAELTGPVSRVVWYDDHPLEASCEKVMVHKSARMHDPNPHVSPGAACICGIYAFHDFETSLANYTEHSLTIAGAGLFWGKIQVYTNGFKSQYARPLALCDHKDLDDRFHSADGYMDPKKQQWEDALEAIAARYSIPLLPVDLVEEYCATWARPLGTEIDE